MTQIELKVIENVGALKERLSQIVRDPPLTN